MAPSVLIPIVGARGRVFSHTVAYSGLVRNRILVFGYLMVFFVVVQTRDALPENDWVIALVATALLTLGLILWVYVARHPPHPPTNEETPHQGD
ncbi:hypothetical protein [Pontimonas salivibrio]|uniref:hypothetical protein n=1 Tax=Pontimonas salivibrio TaxID=1159327 RepID=UPI00131A318D|nr:hypothetical protein [Pontimonas salivibrio]